MIFAGLFVLGLVIGSFLNVLVSRMHSGQDWVKGRSVCDSCAHQLAPGDLVPILSWLLLRGRCRYCQAKLSWQHPAVELLTALSYGLSYTWWPFGLASLDGQLFFACWLACLAGLIALAIYDLKWMVLPNKIIYPTLLIAVLGRLIYLANEPRLVHAAWLWLGSIAVASGLFLILFIVSRGRWIGFGDVRLGLITGTLLANPTKSFMMLFFASLAGTFIAMPLLAARRRSLSSRLPYGPYLILATYFVVLFGQSIIDWYNRTFAA